jgi:hypothetical protein
MKKNRQMRRKQRKLTRHHLKPRSRGGGNESSNIIMLNWDRHQSLHKTFGNRTLEEIFEVLLHWCHYRYVLRGETDKEVLYEHYRKRFNEIS